MGEEKNIKIKSELFLLGKGIVFIASVIGAIWFFGEDSFNAKVDGRIQGFIKSDAMKVYVDGVVKREREKHEKIQIEKNSTTVALRKLLAIKMGVDEDEVHIELGRMYQKEKELKEKIKDNEKEIIKLKTN